MAPRFVELIRVSSAGQAARDTPDDQRRALDALRQHRPGTLVERIEETGSGARDLSRRPDLQRLAVLAADRAFDEVRVRHLDRLTRHADPGERSAILAMVYRAGAIIVDAGGTVLDPRTMAGELVWVVQTLGAAEERRKILERTKAGKDRLAGEGRLVDGRPPWGRRFDGQGWTLCTGSAETYRRLFSLALSGLSLRRIAETINSDGQRAPRGGPWTAGIVLHLLSAEHAAGTYRARGNEIPIPAIVDAATQRRALAAVKRNGKGGRTPSVRALLRLLASCGECGALMRVRPGDDARRYYYACARGCRGWRRVVETDELVVGTLRTWLQRPDVFLGLVAPPPDPAKAEEEIRAAEREVKRLQKAEDDVTTLVSEGLLTLRAARPKLRDLAASRHAAAEALQAAQDRAGAAQGHREAVRDARALLIAYRGRVARLGWQAWRDLACLLLPRTAETGAVLRSDGEVELRPTLPLDASAIGGAEPHGVSWVSAGRGTTLRLVAQRVR